MGKEIGKEGTGSRGQSRDRGGHKHRPSSQPWLEVRPYELSPCSPCDVLDRSESSAVAETAGELLMSSEDVYVGSMIDAEPP